MCMGQSPPACIACCLPAALPAARGLLAIYIVPVSNLSFLLVFNFDLLEALTVHHGHPSMNDLLIGGTASTLGVPT